MIFLIAPDWIYKVPSFVLTLISLIVLMIMMWGFAYLRGKFFPIPILDTSEDDEAHVKIVAKQVVRVGDAKMAEMVDSVEDAALGSNVSTLQARRFLDEAISSLIEEQSDWPHLTDVDRLKAAFAGLKSLGYHTGGGMVEDAGYEVSKARKAEKQIKKLGQKMPGYIFYDLDGVEETVINGHPIYFWYGAAGRKSSAHDELGVANDLNDALKAQGLSPVWDGTLKSQLSLSINWQVRWDESRRTV